MLCLETGGTNPADPLPPKECFKNLGGAWPERSRAERRHRALTAYSR